MEDVFCVISSCSLLRLARWNTCDHYAFIAPLINRVWASGCGKQSQVIRCTGENHNNKKPQENIPIDNKWSCSGYKSSFDHVNQFTERIFARNISENCKPEIVSSRLKLPLYTGGQMALTL